MKADIKYTVKYHSLPVKKVANILFIFAGLIMLLLDIIWISFGKLPLELQAFAILHFIPEVIWDVNIIGLLCVAIGFCLWLLRWRSGRLELTDEKLTIDGSYNVSIWLRNMWEIDIRGVRYHKWIVRLDSNVDAVQIKFRTEKEFEVFSEKIFHLVGDFENIKLYQ